MNNYFLTKSSQRPAGAWCYQHPFPGVKPAQFPIHYVTEASEIFGMQFNMWNVEFNFRSNIGRFAFISVSERGWSRKVSDSFKRIMQIETLCGGRPTNGFRALRIQSMGVLPETLY